jgi:hypothetical protein
MMQMMERVLRSRTRADDDEVRKILAEPDGKDYQDLRDRAAYVYATGSIPSHLRTLMTSLLVRLTKYSRTPVSMDRRIGSMELSQEMIRTFGLDSHPMIVKVRSYVESGYRIQVARDVKARRPYSKVFLWKPGSDEKITVQIDGSVKEGWA